MGSVKRCRRLFRRRSGRSRVIDDLVTIPSKYTAFASDYYEVDIDNDIVAKIFDLQPIIEPTVRALNPSTSSNEIAAELYGENSDPTHIGNSGE